MERSGHDYSAEDGLESRMSLNKVEKQRLKVKEVLSK